MKTLTLTATLLAAAACLPAQERDHFFFEQAVPPPFEAQAHGGTFQFLSGQMVGSAVKASPYSAESVVESIQILADGNRIVNRSTTKLFRDGEGRERREMSLGPNSDVIMISDPVAGDSYTLNPKDKTAEKTPVMFTAHAVLRQDGTSELDMRREPAMVSLPPGVSGTVQGGVTIRTESRTVINNGDRNTVRLRTNPNEENLGAKTIEGVMAQGTRTRSTIPAGLIGNEKPLETVTETWYSPDLKMTVLSETTDPRTGKTTMKLTNISRSEPPRSLFEVPAGYTLQGEAGKTLHIDDQLTIDDRNIRIIQRGGPRK